MDRKKELELLRSLNWLTKAYAEACKSNTDLCMTIANRAGDRGDIREASDYYGKGDTFYRSLELALDWNKDINAKLETIEKETAGARAN